MHINTNIHMYSLICTYIDTYLHMCINIVHIFRARQMHIHKSVALAQCQKNSANTVQFSTSQDDEIKFLQSEETYKNEKEEER